MPCQRLPVPVQSAERADKAAAAEHDVRHIEVENVCPTNAFSNQRLDLSRCFGCGMCANFCSNDAFDMNTGSVDLEINKKEVNIPIICRQSDRLRANKLSLKLKKMIKSGEFKL